MPTFLGAYLAKDNRRVNAKIVRVSVAESTNPGKPGLVFIFAYVLHPIRKWFVWEIGVKG